MDLKSFDTRQASAVVVDVTLVNPATGQLLLTDDGKPVTIGVIGADSDEYVKLDAKLTDRHLSSALGRKGKTKLSSSVLDSNRLELLVGATKRWSGIKEGTQIIDFTPSEARRIYTTYPWIAEQIEHAVMDRGLFLGNLSTSSSNSPN